ncbi:MAG: hypothetical protein PHX43_03270 [Alphaproteobacteria bacterium]|nr:hypothetical protein [Alphaproteobacteria bacterium]
MSPELFSLLSQRGGSAKTGYEELLKKIWTSRPNKFGFQVEGVDFRVQLIPQSENQHLVSAEIGYLPFTAESAQKRHIIKTILDSTSRVKEAKFGISDDGKIGLVGEITVNVNEDPELSFARIIVFLQKTLPYIRLIGKAL